MLEKLKKLKMIPCLFFTGIKESKWINVHYEFESTESGSWFTSGDAHLWEFTERWIYFLGLPLYRSHFNAEDKGVYGG